MPKACPYGMVSENPESTIVAEFEPGYRSSAQYQSEAEMEAEMEADFIRQLERQAYERVNITSEADADCARRESNPTPSVAERQHSTKFFGIH